MFLSFFYKSKELTLRLYCEKLLIYCKQIKKKIIILPNIVKTNFGNDFKKYKLFSVKNLS